MTEHQKRGVGNTESVYFFFCPDSRQDYKIVGALNE